MKIVVVGRPVDVIERDQYAVLTVEYLPKFNGFPKGLPLPSVAEPVSAVCYVAAKPWRKVKAALLANADDSMILEGIIGAPPAAGAALVVLVRSATTVTTQRAAKEAQRVAAVRPIE